MRLCSCGDAYEDYGQKSNLCRECFRAYQRAHHAKRSPCKKARKLELQLKRKRTIAQAVVDYLKEHPCGCGESRIACLQFDHIVPEEKSGNVSDMVGTGKSLKTVMSEIAKCRVLCANCHAVHTAEQLGWYKDLSVAS